MADTGFVIAGAGANYDTGGVGWTDAGRITADDASYAGTFATSSQETDSLQGNTFGLSVPNDATITGVIVRVQLLKTVGSPTVASVNIGEDDSTLGTPKTPATVIQTSFTNHDYGGSGDQWGLTLTPTKVNASTFLARFSVQTSSGTNIVGCDAMWVKVHFTTPSNIGTARGSLIGL